MSGLGTDMVAVACILGGAAVGGVATATVRDGGTDVEHRSAACAVEIGEVGPRMVVVSGDEERVVIAPSAHVEDAEACAVGIAPHVRVRVRSQVDPRVELRIERALERVQRAQERMERARAADVHLEGLDLRLEDLDLDLERLGETLERQIESEVEGRLEREMHELEKRLERLGKEIGR